MRTKLHPPCHVRIKGQDDVLNLRRISFANREMKARGWKGLVAHVQNERGTGIVEYTKLEFVSFKQAEEYYAKRKPERLRYIIGTRHNSGAGQPESPAGNRLPQPGEDGRVV